MSTYKSVSVMSLGTRQAETNPSSFTPFHHVSRRFSGRTGRTECANWLWAGLFILHLDLLCVFAMIRVGIDVVQIHVFTFAWLMLFVEVLLKWRFIWCFESLWMSEQVRSCWRTPSPGVPLRNGALGGDVEQQTRDGSEYWECRPGSLHQSKSLSEVLKSWWLAILVLVFALIACRISVFLNFLR